MTTSRDPNRHYTQSSSFKMALLFSVLCGAAVLILAYFSYYFYRGHFVHGTEAVLETEIRHLSTLDDYGVLEDSLENSGRVYLLYDRTGQKITGNIDKKPAELTHLAEGTIVFTRAGQRYAAKIHSFPDGRRMLIGVEISDVERDYTLMKWLSILSIVLMVLVVAVSFVISAFVVGRTNRIANIARRIMRTGDLSERIPVHSRWDDLSNMASVLNELLERVEFFMQGVRQVSDNIAHDLRTPLMRMRNTIEKLGQSEAVRRDVSAQQEYVKLAHEADHLLNTFNALLRISRIESGKQSGVFESVNLQQLCHDVIDFYEPLAEEKNIALTGDLTPVNYRCDRDLIFQALANLMDNAIKFTPENGAVSLAVREDGARAVLEIADTGPGVPEGELEKIFQRFYRAEGSRSAPGTGLGLSLVAAIVCLHGGRIEAVNADSGLRIRIVM